MINGLLTHNILSKYEFNVSIHNQSLVYSENRMTQNSKG